VSLLSIAAGGLHRTATGLKNTLYDHHALRPKKLAKPVISIGNLALGGTGKTPVCIWLHGQLQARGHRPSILLRGYSTGRICDEAILYARHCRPSDIYVGPDRYALGLRAEREGHDVHLLDDGFQHRQLHRDCNIVLIDCSDPWNRRAWLREGPASLKRATILLLTRAEHRPGPDLAPLLAHAPDLPPFDVRFPPAAELEGRTVFAFCGIGNPDSFRQSIVGAGGTVRGFRPFRDHHEYTQAELGELRREADNTQSELLLTTEKDLCRMSEMEAKEFRIESLCVRTEIGKGFLAEVLRQMGDFA